MGTKGRQPVIEPVLTQTYGGKDKTVETLKANFEKKFSDKTLKEAYPVIAEAVKKKTNITISSMGLYTYCKKTLDFSFKASAGKGKKSVVMPQLIEHYKTEEAFLEALQGVKEMDAHEAHAAIQKESKVEFSFATFSGIAKKNEITFPRKKVTAKASPKFDEFIEKSGGKKEARKLLNSLKKDTVTKATPQINDQLKTDFSISNIYSFANKMGIEFKKGRKQRPQETVTVEVPREIPKIPVKMTCSKCGHESGQHIEENMLFPLGLAGRRCKGCNEFATQVASYSYYGRKIQASMSTDEGHPGEIFVELDDNGNVIEPQAADAVENTEPEAQVEELATSE